LTHDGEGLTTFKPNC